MLGKGPWLRGGGRARQWQEGAGLRCWLAAPPAAASDACLGAHLGLVGLGEAGVRAGSGHDNLCRRAKRERRWSSQDIMADLQPLYAQVPEQRAASGGQEVGFVRAVTCTGHSPSLAGAATSSIIVTTSSITVSESAAMAYAATAAAETSREQTEVDSRRADGLLPVQMSYLWLQ